MGAKRLPVDGFCAETNTVFQFHGCFWHGHQCSINTDEYNPVRKMSMEDLRQQTTQTSVYIRQQGYELIEMWECEWRHIQATDPDARQFIESHRLPHYHRKTMTELDILNAVMDGSMFGLVQCDIEVLPALRDHLEEMPQIFKNVDISRADIGDHMRDYAEREGLMKTSRRSLIGSMHGQCILLATLLLQWYLNHGL